MSTLIMSHNRFCENRNNAVEVHIPRYSKPKSHDVEIVRPKNRNIEIWGLKHGDIKKRRQLSHDIVFQDTFSVDKKPDHRDSKTKKPRLGVSTVF